MATSKSTSPTPNHADLYAALAAPFERTLKDTRGGVTFDYATGEQVVSRLNEVLGIAGWSFDIRQHGINAEADEVWVLGSLEVRLGDVTLTRQQFGSQKLKRARARDGQTGPRPVLDIGFDLKGAGTDCLKKCASLIGVGLYLYEKEGTAIRESSAAASNAQPAAQSAPASNPGPQAARPSQTAPGPQSGASGQPAANGAPATASATAPTGDAEIHCSKCNAVLTATRFRDGTVWTVDQLADNGSRKFGRRLCFADYKAAKDAKRAEPA